MPIGSTSHCARAALARAEIMAHFGALADRVEQVELLGLAELQVTLR